MEEITYEDPTVAEGIAATVRLAQEHGLRQGAGTVLYCGGAINAAGLALALHEIGVDDVVLHDGSLSEWRAHPDLPLVTGPEENDRP
ncbi:hypothetical protein ACIOHS_39995 [Streptomyces sp. NPDC088253]|uniref:hypothetical protein n=1 Tax=Streptomyces sp. NPDC088253 TaxID=3365846 RepID=UPI0038086F1A